MLIPFLGDGAAIRECVNDDRLESYPFAESAAVWNNAKLTMFAWRLLNQLIVENTCKPLLFE